jgi:hypothetical protein
MRISIRQTLRTALPVLLSTATYLCMGCGSPSDASAAQDVAVSTPQGILDVTSVETPDSFPPYCTPQDPECESAVSGYQLLLVWLAPKGGGTPASFLNYVEQTFPSATVTAGSGDVTTGSGGGLLGGNLFVLFTPPDTESSWSLGWPGNNAQALPPAAP